MAATFLTGSSDSTRTTRRIVLGAAGLAVVVGAALVGWSTSRAGATLTCTKNWKPTVNSGSYGTATNWVEGVVPTSGDTICSPAGKTITLGTGQTVTAAKLDGALVISAGTFTVTGTVDPSTIYDLTLSGTGSRAGAAEVRVTHALTCLLYTSDAADE